MKKQPDISSADQALFAIADLLKKEGNIEKIARICAEALMANDIHQSAFNELYEKYQIREKQFSETLREREHDYQTKLLENKKIYEDQIRYNLKKLSEEAQNGISEALQLGNAVVEQFKKNELPEIFKEQLTDTYIAGQKDGGKARAKVSAHKSHEDDYAIKRDIFKWFDVNYMNYPRNMQGCAEAATKQQPIKTSTAMTYLREWKKLQK